MCVCDWGFAWDEIISTLSLSVVGTMIHTMMIRYDVTTFRTVMLPINRHHGHRRDGGRDGIRREEDRCRHSSRCHDYAGYDGGHRHHPRRDDYHPGRGGGDMDASAPKRPASTSPDRQRRSADDAMVPDEVHSAVKVSELTIDDVSEEEEANRRAYEDCLRDIDKDVPVWKLAHQLPMDRWNAKEGKLETWDERKERAMMATIESIGEDLMSGKITRPKQGEDDDDRGDYSSDDTLPPGASRRSKTNGKHLSTMEESFIKALPYCLPLDRGFHVTELRSSKICYCPCGPNVAPWRKARQVSVDDVCDKTTQRFEPNDLMDHLKETGGVFEEREQKKKVRRDLRCMFHYAAAEYLRELYKDWHGKLPKRIIIWSCLL